MIKVKLFSKLMLIIYMTALICCGSAYAGVIGITTGPSSLTYYQQGKEIKEACPNLAINVFNSNGGISNIANLFTSNQMQFGFIAYDAMWFKQLTDARKMAKIKVVMPLNMNTIHLIANTRAGIRDLKDLEGKRVNIGPPGSGSYISASIIRLKTGIKWHESSFSNKEALVMVQRGDLDAIFYFSAMPVKGLVELGKDVTGIIELVNMKHPALDGFYTLTEVPAGLYPWQAKAAFQYSVRNLLVTYDYKTPGKIQDVTELTTCIMDALPQLQETGHPAWREVDPKGYPDVKWEMHPAAKRVIDAR